MLWNSCSTEFCICLKVHSVPESAVWVTNFVFLPIVVCVKPRGFRIENAFLIVILLQYL